MLFSSIFFIFVFLPVFFAMYFLVPFKFKNTVILIFSLIFYAWGEPIYIFLMILSCFVDLYCGAKISGYDEGDRRRRRFLVLSIFFNVLMLGFFKYADFLITITNGLFQTEFPLLALPLPIGISFYTFQTMSYTFDIYLGNTEKEHSIANYITYVCLFPQLIAGPIVRYKTVAQELRDREISLDNVTTGFMRFLRGLFRKVLIANQAGALFAVVNELNFETISWLTAMLGLVAFALQIYFDFDGYSDMAIGIGKMIGFNFEENFDDPYIARSITDFWRRWHMSLSTWFRDYVYIPLGGSRHGVLKQIRNIAFVWLLTGIWHGASFNFILWGVYFGVILIIEKFVIKRFLENLPRFFQHIYALILILFGWVLFMFEDFTHIVQYTQALLRFDLLVDYQARFLVDNYLVVLMLGIVLSTPILRNFITRLKAKHNGRLVFATTALVYGVLFIVTTAYLVSDSYNPFLYFRF